jgi:hypothetical protein
MTRCRSLAAAQPKCRRPFRRIQLDLIQEPCSPLVAAASNSKNFLALQNHRVRCSLMNKICLLLTLLFCTLCCILHIAEARESTATTADPDAVFWNWKNKNNRETGSFTYWIMPLGLYPRCACAHLALLASFSLFAAPWPSCPRSPSVKHTIRASD